ncbi:MAG: hypothetical protein WC450_09650 [Candidatus Omnitrophota bacterium]|jgi:hypothetical protein
MVERTAGHEAHVNPLRLGEGGRGIRATLVCPADEPLSGPKSTWLEMAYHEGYLSRKKFRELKKRYDKVYTLMTQGREGPPS